LPNPTKQRFFEREKKNVNLFVRRGRSAHVMKKVVAKARAR